jgi:pimeloyl-ACP methyl ester carboxylesterase
MREEAISFGEFKSLVGIVTNPGGQNKKHGKTAVVLLNPGIVHRVGPGRVYVKIARVLASIGFVTLRFDFSGIGDSIVRHDNLRFEKSAVNEARDAMDFLAKTRGIEHFILLGGCSGAEVALETARCDTRVIGALLINFPITRKEDGVANANLIHRGASYYYRNYALFNLRSWFNLIVGRANYRQIALSLWYEAKRRLTFRKNTSREATEFESHLRLLADRDVRLAFLCSEGDPRLEDLREAGGVGLKELCATRSITLEILKRSDHTFSSLQDQEQLMKVLLERADMISPAEKEPANAFQVPTGAEASKALFHQLQSNPDCN